MAILPHITTVGILAVLLTGCLDTGKDPALAPPNTPPVSGEAIVKHKDSVSDKDSAEMIGNLPSPVYEFGDYYRYIEREGLPTMQGDSLRVWISYSGCGPGAPFTLQHARTGGSSHEVWLYKQPGTTCAAVMADKNRGFKLPAEIAAGDTVRLIKPGGGSITLGD